MPIPGSSLTIFSRLVWALASYTYVTVSEVKIRRDRSFAKPNDLLMTVGVKKQHNSVPISFGIKT